MTFWTTSIFYYLIDTCFHLVEEEWNSFGTALYLTVVETFCKEYAPGPAHEERAQHWGSGDGNGICSNPHSASPINSCGVSGHLFNPPKTPFYSKNMLVCVKSVELADSLLVSKRFRTSSWSRLHGFEVLVFLALFAETFLQRRSAFNTFKKMHWEDQGKDHF